MAAVESMKLLSVNVAVPRAISFNGTTVMTGIFKDAGSPSFRQHHMVETTSRVSVYHCELFVAGVQIYLYDVFANIYVVGGVDQLSNFRSNIGG